MVIWKQVLQATDVQEVMLPTGAEILCAREQYDRVCIWFKCDPEQPKTVRAIALCGTGHAVPHGGGRYLGTASLHGGSLIVHAFERTN